MPNLITINARKFDGTIHRSWSAELIRREGSLLVFFGIFQNEVSHPELGVIRRGTMSYEYYWLDRWYNVFRFHEPDGAFRNYYCNVNLPPEFDGSVLNYVDLDLDLLIRTDRIATVLDREEFETNSRLFDYPDAVRTGALAALDELLHLANAGTVPFENFETI